MTIKDQRHNITKKSKFIALLWMTFPVSFLVFSKLVFQVNMGGIARTVLSPSFWITSALAIFAGYGLRSIKWFAWYAFLTSHLLVAYETALVLAYFSESDYKTMIFILTSVWQCLLLYIVATEIRVPYFSPRVRWWVSDPRYKFSVPVKILREPSHSLDAEIMDVSRGGCFIKTNSGFELNDTVHLEFTLFETTIRCEGQVVWNTESTVTHPKGIGVKFTVLDKPSLLHLKHAVIKLKKMAQMYSDMIREKNWQDYLDREQQFQDKLKKTGEK